MRDEDPLYAGIERQRNQGHDFGCAQMTSGKRRPGGRDLPQHRRQFRYRVKLVVEYPDRILESARCLFFFSVPATGPARVKRTAQHA